MTCYTKQLRSGTPGERFKGEPNKPATWQVHLQKTHIQLLSCLPAIQVNPCCLLLHRLKQCRAHRPREAVQLSQVLLTSCKLHFLRIRGRQACLSLLTSPAR